MKQVLIAITMIVFTGAVQADPVEGVWKTQPGEDGAFGHVTIRACGTKICGALTKSYDPSGVAFNGEYVGRLIIWDMEPEGAGSYSKGKIWAPDQDKTYNAKMALSGNSLKVSGCVFGICRGQTWSRIK